MNTRQYFAVFIRIKNATDGRIGNLSECYPNKTGKFSTAKKRLANKQDVTILSYSVIPANVLRTVWLCT